MALVVTLLASGCGERVNQVGDAEAKSAVKELSQKTGLVLPEGAKVINQGDGGGREQTHGFYIWAIYSPTPISMPISHQPGVKDYLALPLDDTVKYVEQSGEKKIVGAKLALSRDWETNGFGFGGTLVRGDNGDYLVVTQGKK